jgi:hypothetical protein
LDISIGGIAIESKSIHARHMRRPGLNCVGHI